MLRPKIQEIIKRRNVLGLSRLQVSKKAEVGGNSLSRIEAGKVGYVHRSKAKVISEALECKIEDIFEEL